MTMHPALVRRHPGFPEPEVVLFDLGEVLATPKALHETLADAVAMDAPAELERAYWEHRDDYDRGGSATAFWRSVLEDVSVPARNALIDELTAIDTGAWTMIRDDAAAVLRQLSAAGVRVGILSNATVEMAVAARTTSWAEWVSDWFFSSELHMSKPSPVLYEHVTQKLAVEPQAICFIDDRAINVTAAREAGWNAHLWTSGADTQTLLTELGLLPAGSAV